MKKLARAMLLTIISSLAVHTAYADDGGSYSVTNQCETRVWKADVIKGLEGAVEVHAISDDGCNRYDYTNYVGADRGMQGTPREDAWQQSECMRIGILDSQNLWRYTWNKTLAADQVKVTCKHI